MWIASGLISETGIAERAVHRGVRASRNRSLPPAALRLKSCFPMARASDLGRRRASNF